MIVNVLSCFARIKSGTEDLCTMLVQRTTDVTIGQSDVCIGSLGNTANRYPATPVLPGSELIRAAENIAPTPIGPKCP